MDVRIIDELVSVVVDPAIHGLDASFFKTITGTPAIVSSKYRYNSAETNTYPEFVYGEYEFPLVIPVEPTGGHVRSWGLRGKSLGNRGAMVFDINGTTFSVKVYDKDGTVLSRTITWNAAWTAAEVKYRIGWSATGTTFSIITGTAANDFTCRLQPTGQNFSANLPLGISVVNGVADNMDLTHLYILQAGRVRGISAGGTISSITPGTGATDLGKAEDAAHASGDTGIAVWAVRKDTATALAGTDGDYSPFITDANNLLWVTLGTKISGEDQTNDKMKVEQQFSPSYISTATTTTIRSGAGLLHSITITESVASTIIVYDNTAGSGTILASFVASAAVGTYLLDVVYGTGLTVVTAGASKLTVSYR